MAHMVVRLQGQPQVAEVVKEHTYTVWVRLRRGAVIKRHRVKHRVESIQE